MARADMHVFGSVSGYRTIAASVGLRPDETRELEHFQFGEISTSDAIARLETQPTMTSRMLSSGRIALSRMLPAGVDDAGRPTIEVITFVVDAKTYHANLGSLAVLADDASLWVAARDNARAGFDLPRGDALPSDPRDPSLLRILDAWMLATRTGSVATLPEASMTDLLRFVATLDPSDRARCRWGLGINSLSAPVDVCTMMPGASTHGARSIVRPAPAGQWHVQETEFAQFRATSGGSTWVPTTQMIGAATVSSAESGGGDARDIFASKSAHGALSDRQKRVMVMSVIAAICSSLLFTAAAAVYIGSSPPRTNGAVLAGGDDSGASDPFAPLPPIGGSRRSGFGEAIETPVVSAPTEPVVPTAEQQAGPTGIVAGADVRAEPTPNPGPESTSGPESATSATPSVTNPPPTQTQASPTSAKAGGLDGKNEAPIDATVIPDGEPSAESKPADTASEYIVQLRILRDSFKALREWEPPDQSRPTTAHEAEKQRLENLARDRGNFAELERYFEVLWKLQVLDDSWREMKREGADMPSVRGGVLQRSPADREDHDIVFLEEWRKVVEAARDWVVSFKVDGDWINEKRLEELASLFADAKKDSSEQIDRQAYTKRASSFPLVLTARDWQRELFCVDQRLAKARNKSSKSEGGK